MSQFTGLVQARHDQVDKCNQLSIDACALGCSLFVQAAIQTGTGTVAGCWSRQTCAGARVGCMQFVGAAHEVPALAEPYHRTGQTMVIALAPQLLQLATSVSNDRNEMRLLGVVAVAAKPA